MPFDAKLPIKDAHIRHGDLAAYAGIASGYVTAWADALGTTPSAIEAAAKEVPPLMDTAEPPKCVRRQARPAPRCTVGPLHRLDDRPTRRGAGGGRSLYT